MSVVATAGERFVVCCLGEERVGLGVGSVREVVQACRLTVVPRAPAGVRGLINLRGSVVPVVSLAEKLGIAGDGRAQCIVVCEWQGEPVGLLVDDVLAVAPLAPEPADALGTAVAERFVRGLGRTQEGELVLLLDVPALLEE